MCGTAPKLTAPRKKPFLSTSAGSFFPAPAPRAPGWLAISYWKFSKTIRGYGGSAVCASQDLNDFFNLDEGRFGKGIINNSKTKIILNLEDDEAERVQETLHLSDAETMEVTHFERGNGLISTNNNNIMVEFKASPLEKDLITTDRRELREILERKRREQESA